ncbi:HTH domain-containing protein [Haloarcula laminariae]|uniref:HTH domain-containing protein n=1 Tax=Haloarcula laminariae TaxID=2961577 RepID=UPI0021C968CE|nr:MULTISPECIES: HTH domain-containing protein [Halomicroarcula]
MTDDTHLRAELYLRGDTYGTFDAQQQVLNRVNRLEANGVFTESMVAGEWQRIRTMAEDTRSGALATYEEFDDWADRNDSSLEPAFEHRTRTYVGMDQVDEVVVFPVVSLAIYDEKRLQSVFPCSDGEHVYTVGDALDAFERGDEAWLAQFDAVTVDRTEPWLEAGVEALP